MQKIGKLLFYEHQKNFLCQMDGLGTHLEVLSKQSKACVMSILVDHFGRFPIVIFDENLMEFIVKMGATLELEVYDDR